MLARTRGASSGVLHRAGVLHWAGVLFPAGAVGGGPRPADPEPQARPLLDVLVAALVVGVFWLPATSGPPDWRRWLVGCSLALVMAVAIALRKRFSGWSTTVAVATTIAGNSAGVCQDPMLGAAWCLYALALRRAPHAGGLVPLLVGVLAALATVMAVPADGPGATGQRLVVAVGALSVAWLLGTAIGRQIAAARRAERAQTQLEAAREVHDIVGHALGTISAEAGVTRSLPDADEQELRRSLAGIEAHAREALEEVQALVRALRSAPEQPAAGLARLASVAAVTRAAGVPVELRVDVADRVGHPVGAVALRIVQESLSNVVRHAPGAECTVDVRADDGSLVVRVRDTGPGAGARTGGGFGLVGMRERARLAGGEVTWRDHPEGGFEVEARLPVRGSG